EYDDVLRHGESSLRYARPPQLTSPSFGSPSLEPYRREVGASRHPQRLVGWQVASSRRRDVTRRSAWQGDRH
ncbi:MAG: hypothetical protein ACE1Z9_01215, partial [Acidimicrobiia bacterium]